MKTLVVWYMVFVQYGGYTIDPVKSIKAYRTATECNRELKKVRNVVQDHVSVYCKRGYLK